MTTTTNTPAPITERAATIRPGVLVVVKSSVFGGVTYQRTDLDADGMPVEEGADVARWETTRIIEDKDEHERAVKARGKAISLIRKECQETTFGLLCPEQREGALDAAIAKAREIVDAHNASAASTKISIHTLKGRVASNDAEAARAITSEIGQLVVQMDRGIAQLDSKAIRAAADRAREMSAMLDDSVKGKIDAAIEQARKAARTIVKRIEKEGEDKAIVLMDIQRGQIESARIAFLDMSGDNAAPVEALPAVQAQRFAALDVDNEGDAEPAPSAPHAVKPALDLADDAEPVAVAARAASVPMMELL